MSIVKTMRGKALDMNALIASYGDKPVRGNVNVNARGDLIDRKTGKVLKKRDQMTMEYNKMNPKAVKHVAMNDLSSQLYSSPAEAVKDVVAKNEAAKEAAKKARKLTDE